MGRTIKLENIFKHKKGLLLFLTLPVIATAVFAVFMLHYSINTLKQNSDKVFKLQSNRLKAIDQLNVINESIVFNHRMVQEALEGASAGTKSMLELYRIHSNVVDTLIFLEQKINDFANLEVFSSPEKHQKITHLKLIKSEYKNYISFLIMATDIIAIAPEEALGYIVKAQNHYIQYSLHANQMASYLSENTRITLGEQSDFIQDLYRKTLLLSVLTMLFIFSVTVLISWKLNQYVLKLMQKANLASQAKGEFLANMSHEIRTPLNGVIGFTELLKNTSLSQTQKQYIDYVDVSANSLMGIINDILDFSKIESGKLELDKSKSDIVEIAEQVADIMSFQTSKKDVELILDVQPGIPFIALVDEVRLRQILTNLLSNAAKFTNEGEIQVKLSFSKLNDRIGKFYFSVKDTGLGITKEQQKKLFHAFSQGDTSISRKYGGTGLGLVISNKLAEKMGSKISLDSEYKRGSTFSFEFMTEYEYKKVKYNKKEQSLRSVLLVDDNETNLFVMKNHFTYYGFECHCCSDGLSAINMLREREDIDLLIIDYSMPGMNGLETIEKIRVELNISSESLPVILLHNTSKDWNIKTMGRELGIIDFIAKPVKVRKLLCLINNQKCEDLKRDENQEQNSIESRNKQFQNKLKILVAEDNEINMLLAKKILTSVFPNVEIFEANNGMLAVKMCKEKKIDLILMDVQMPEMDGLTATKKIREMERETNTHVPIIALSAGILKNEVEKALESGIDDFVSKPLKSDALIEVIDKLIEIN